jgi:hypothetical protein
MPNDTTLRGAGFAPLLERQRDYARREGPRSRFGLMVPEAFVRGIRDLGYRSTGDAVAELIDNALQAHADRIDILLGYDGSPSARRPTQLAVVDNGHGMEPDMIRMAVMWGGTHRENDRSGLGRYGYGLPCASVSLGRRFQVFSRVEGGEVHVVELDLDAITAGAYTDPTGDIVVPPPRPAVLPDFVTGHLTVAYPDGWPSGTVILIDKLDRLDWTTTGGLRENLCREFGVTYHKLRSEAALFVDGIYVEPIDPLFLTAGFRFHDLDDDRAQAFDPVRIEVRDPDTDAWQGALTLRYAWFPPSFGSVDKTRDAVGINANPRFSILKDYHGVLFSRNGRLIDVQTRTPWTTFINNDRYIKVEVEFTATLDEAFGVTTSKQQVTATPRIWDLLREAGASKAIEQLRIKVKAAKAERRSQALMPPPGQERPSERAMGAVGAVDWGMPEPGRPPSLRRAVYRVAHEHLPDAPLVRASAQGGLRTLHLNTATHFHDVIYAGPDVTPEGRAGLEVLLFALGDLLLDGDEETRRRRSADLRVWSDRVERGLGGLASDLGGHEDEEIYD